MAGRNRLGTHDVATLRSFVNDRDLEILRRIREHKFLTTKHIQRLQFWDHATPGAAIRACVRVLSRLEARGLIYKLERQIGGIHAGSASYVWGIDDAGDRLMRADEAKPDTKRSRPFEPTPLFLAHTLAIAETRVLLEEAAHVGPLELLSVTTEPTNWRNFLGKGGSAQTLKPDLHAVTARHDFEDHWLIEIDNGTESLPTVINKCLIYQRYYKTGVEQAASGVFPMVVWIIASSHRRTRLKAAIAKDTRLEQRLFEVIGPEKFIPLATEPPTPDQSN